METMNFRIKEISDQKGITLKDLAQRSGVARESLSGQVFKNPTLKTLSKIADVLGVEVYELFEIKPNIDELKPFANNIYNFLADSSSFIKSDASKEQVAEEIEKAKQIVSDTTNTWESKIIEAEKTAFFKGVIRFLFRTGINSYDWNKFDDRFSKAKEYFNEKGVNENYRKDAILLRALISKFTIEEYFKSIYYDNEASSWKEILRSELLSSVLTLFFDVANIKTLDFTSFNSTIVVNDNRLRDFQNDLCTSTILNCISPESYFHKNNYKYSLFPYNTKSQSKIFVLADKRNQVISALDGVIIEVENWQRVEGLPYFRGWELYFTSKHTNYKYQWRDSLKFLTVNGDWDVISGVNLDNLEEFFKGGEKIVSEENHNDNLV